MPATPSLMSRILHYWGMSGFEPREQARYTNLATHLPGKTYVNKRKNETRGGNGVPKRDRHETTWQRIYQSKNDSLTEEGMGSQRRK